MTIDKKAAPPVTLLANFFQLERIGRRNIAAYGFGNYVFFGNVLGFLLAVYADHDSGSLPETNYRITLRGVSTRDVLCRIESWSPG